MSFDPIADVLRAHDSGLVLLSGPLECPGHVLLPWFAHAALRGGGGGGIGGGGSRRSATAPPSAALVVLAAAHPPAAHAAALRKVQQQTTQQTTHAPLPVVYVEPRLPGPDDEDDDDDDEEEGGGEQGNGGGWLRRLSADVASAVRQQAEALMTPPSSSSSSEQRRLPQPPQVTVLVDSLTVLAAAADAGAAAAPTSITAPRPSPAHLRWLAFLHTLASLEAQAPTTRVRVVALCADDVPADAPWRRWLRHRCSAALTLCPVEGRTAGLDGELRVEARAAEAEEDEGGLLFADRWAGASGGGRCFFRASELSVRWLRDVQGADLMR